MNWSEEEYMKYLEEKGQKTARKKPKKRRPKYNNKSTWIDGVHFDSRKEGEYYNDLKLLLIGQRDKGILLAARVCTCRRK